MIRLVYDPLKGECIHDGLCVQRAQELIKNHADHNAWAIKSGRPIVVTQWFANELYFHAFRLQVKLGMIPCEDVEVAFGDHKITIDKDGRCPTWPRGFCDHTDYLLSALLD